MIIESKKVRGRMGGELVERVKRISRRRWRIFEEKPFLKAFVSEEAGNYLEAAQYYLIDAERCERRRLKNFASISYASAARCLELYGDYEAAIKYYLRAANLLESLMDEIGARGSGLKERITRYRDEAKRLSSLLNSLEDRA